MYVNPIAMIQSAAWGEDDPKSLYFICRTNVQKLRGSFAECGKFQLGHPHQMPLWHDGRAQRFIKPD